MNYIQSLQTVIADQDQKIAEMRQQIEDMRAHLLSSKFVAVQPDGSRGDWIATLDVLRFLEGLRRVSY